MSGPTRGFTGRPRPEHGDRLPPGQYDTGADFPVLTAEVTPRLDPRRWSMTVDGLVQHERSWTQGPGKVDLSVIRGAGGRVRGAG